MTVLVTGGAGYIGSHTVYALVEAGESVVVIDNLSTGFSEFLPEGAALFVGDASDESLVERVIASHRVESIIHFAGSVVVGESMRDPLGYYRNNTMTTRSLFERGDQMRRQPLHLFFHSCRVRQPGSNARSRTCADSSLVSLRLFQADERNHAA
jgi:UDP-glucose 4-epimerase